MLLKQKVKTLQEMLKCKGFKNVWMTKNARKRRLQRVQKNKRFQIMQKRKRVQSKQINEKMQRL